MRQVGLLEHIAPQVWTIPWNVHSQAQHHGYSAFTYLAPYVCKVAIANSRIVSLKDRTVTFTYRQPGSARPRTTHLDAIEFLRRFLQHVLPDGFMKVRHFGFLHANCAISTDTLRRMIVQAHPIGCKLTRIVPPEPLAALCPTCGAPLRVVMRLWTPNSAVLDTG
jgi:Putative transposase